MMQELVATGSFNEKLVRKSSGTMLLKTTDYFVYGRFFHVTLCKQH